MYAEPGEVYVRRVHAVSDERDALALRLRLTSALAEASLHPPGLPRSAVVCVRRLRTPRSAAFGAGRHAVHARRAWAEACAASISRMLSSAARPARGFVPAAAESVVFADRAELLACLAGDWCAGEAWTRWWWRALFRQKDAGAALLEALRAEPEYVPGALEHLARRDLARDFARVLPAEAARSLLDGVVRRFALRELGDALAEVRSEHTASAMPRAGTVSVEADEPNPAAPTAAAPWRHIVPETAVTPLGIDAACLLGVGLTLQRAPAVARAPTFARGLRDWMSGRIAPNSARIDGREQATEQTHEPSAEPEAIERFVPRRRSEERAEASTLARTEEARLDPRANEDDGLAPSIERLQPVTLEGSQAVNVEPDVPEVARASDAQVESGEPVLNAELCVELAPDEVRRAEAGEWQTRSVDEEIEVSAVSTEELMAAPEERAAFVRAADVFPLEAQIETRFGGLFFLVNLGLFLELYGDFSSPLTPGLALPVWDFCALLGERLCGRGLRDDPVWELLAQLAGRDARTEPGAGFEPPAEWRVPPAWLRPLPHVGAWRWSSARGRLRVAHPKGFLVLDVARDESLALSQLKTELREQLEVHASTSLRRVRRPLRVRGRTRLAHWLTLLSAYARVRLCYALGCEARSLASLLCERLARVSVTTTHVDVCMPLSELPVAVRLAGLDRDPGWVPAAGRSIAFHFD